MKLLLILLLGVILTDPITVRKVNSAKSEAKNAFQAGDYSKAVNTYRYLIDSLGVNDDEVRLNLAHALYLQKDTANALPAYQSLMSSSKNQIASKANLHAGLMMNQRGKAEEALSMFKQAVKSDPTNEEARYNYEMLKKKLDDQKKKEEEQKQKDEQNKDQNQKQDKQKEEQQKKEQEQKQKEEQQKKEQEQQKKDQEKKEQEKKEQEKKEQEKEEQDQEEKEQKKPNLDKEKLEQMKISEEKAKMILEAMKNQEKQYLQQNKRKATKARDRGKPDW